MKATTVLISVIFLVIFSEIEGYSKYGRTCQEIGCANNEECVMKEDPCNGYNECGRYPTCQKASQLSCSNIECPLGQECISENGSARCGNRRSSSSVSNYPQSNGAANAPPVNPSGDGTTSRPRPAFAQYPSGGTGYVGGQPGSGYPGQQPGSGYPGQQPGSGYPAPAGYPTPGAYPAPAGYPGQQRPNSGYPGGYPGAGYPSNGYSGSGYPNNGGYSGNYRGSNYNGYPPNNGYAQYPPNNQYAAPYPQSPPPKSSTSSFTDQLTQRIKTIAGNYLKDQIAITVQKTLNQATTSG